MADVWFTEWPVAWFLALIRHCCRFIKLLENCFANAFISVVAEHHASRLSKFTPTDSCFRCLFNLKECMHFKSECVQHKHSWLTPEWSHAGGGDLQLCSFRWHWRILCFWSYLAPETTRSPYTPSEANPMLLSYESFPVCALYWLEKRLMW